MIKNFFRIKHFIFIILIFFIITCEDKKKETDGFGSLNLNITLANKSNENANQFTQSNIVKNDQQAEDDSSQAQLKEEKIKFDDDFLIYEKIDEKSDLFKDNTKETNSFSSVRYVKITVANVDTLELVVNGSSSSATIEKIPIGTAIVTIELSNSNKEIMYAQTQTVEIEKDKVSTPAFNDFIVKNESLKILQPNGGENYDQGETIEIRWDKTHQAIPVDLKISSNTNSEFIARNVPNTGSFSYSLPYSVKAGGDYKIQINSSNNNNINDLSDDSFNIANMGNALSFDGSDDKVDLGKLGLTNKLTISTWFNTNSDKAQRIISSVTDGNSNNYFIMFDPNQSQGRQFKFKIRDSEVYASKSYTAYTDGQWHNAIGTWDGSTMKLYIDGEFISEKSGADLTLHNINTHLGYTGGGGGSYFFDGKIDETAIWNKALSANEVTALYNSGVALDARANSGNYNSSDDLIGYWKMEDASGTTLTDVSGNSNDGRIYGTSWELGTKSSNYDNTPRADILAPAIPKDLKGIIVGNAIELTWNPNTEKDLAKYHIWGGTDNSLSTKIGEVEAGKEKFLYNNIKNGSTYFFGISAVDNNENESLKSSAISLKVGLTANAGNALSFDGSDYVSLEASSAFDVNQFTISGWVNKTDEMGYIFQAEPSFGYYFMIGKNDKLHLAFPGGSASCTANTALYDNQWYMVTATYSGSEAKLYINGIIDKTCSMGSRSSGNGSSAMTIGSWGPQTHIHNFEGKIDETAFWDKKLSADEITALYNSGVALDARSNSGNYNSSDDLIGYWKMEDASGTTLTDVSGNSNDGTISGASWTTGVESTSYYNNPINANPTNGGHALDFTADQSQYVSLPEISNELGTPNSSYSASLWFRANSNMPSGTAGQDGVLIHSSYSNRPYFSRLQLNTTTNRFYFYDRPTVGNDTEGWFSTNYKDDIWNHVVLTKSGGNTKLYVNGILDPTIFSYDDNNNYYSSERKWEIGNLSSAPSYHAFHGAIDETAIWNKALSADEVTALYNSGVALDARANSGNYNSSNNLAGYWKMEDANGTTLTDVSGNGNNGVINNASWTASGIESTSYDNTPLANNSNPKDGGNALSFKGTDYVTIGTVDNTLSGTYPFSLSLWFFGKGVNDTENIFTKGKSPNSGTTNPKSIQIFRDGPNNYSFILYTDNNNYLRNQFSSSILNDANWNHIVATYDGGTGSNSIKLHINGSSPNQTSNGRGTFSGIDVNSDPIIIGARQKENGESLKGWNDKIDEVAIWDKKLSADEATALYNSGVALDARANSGNYNSSDDLIGYWKMEDASGTTLTDVSGNSNDGAISGASWTTGVESTSYDNSSNKSLSFDGQDDYAIVPDSDELDGMSELTVSLDVKFKSNSYKTYTKGQVLIDKWQNDVTSNSVGAYSMYTHNDENNLSFTIQTQSNQHKGVNINLDDVELNKWYNIVGRYDGERVEIYLDGKLKANKDASGNVKQNSYPLEIGYQTNSKTKFFHGNIDNVAIWDKALSVDEITSLYNNGNTKSASIINSGNLKAYYKMNGTDSKLIDSSGNNNDGTITGASREER